MVSDWEKYFYDLALDVSKNSKCMSRKVGAVLVRDKSILATGYNGPPRGIPHCNERLLETKGIPDTHLLKLFKYEQKELTACPRQLLGYRSGEGLEICIAAHAERNAIVDAARRGIEVKGSMLYLTCNVPCKDCLIEIINAGIQEVIVVDSTSYYDVSSEFLVLNSSLIVRNYNFKGEN